MKAGGEMSYFFLDEAGKKVYCDIDGNELPASVLEPAKEEVHHDVSVPKAKSKAKKETLTTKDSVVHISGDMVQLLRLCMMVDDETVLSRYVVRILSDYIGTRLPEVRKGVNDMLKGR